jgi:hypothetical protein
MSPNGSENPYWLGFSQQDCNELLRQFGFQPRVREPRFLKMTFVSAPKNQKTLLEGRV